MAQNETFERDYLIPREQYNPDDHERQFNDVRTQAIQQGWHPTGDVQFDGAQAHGAVTVRLKYSVPVVAASTAEDYETQHVRVPQDAQEALEQAVSGDKHIDEADKELAEAQAEAARSRTHDEEPTPVPDDVPEGGPINTGPSEPGEEGERPPPRKIHSGDSEETEIESGGGPATTPPETAKPRKSAKSDEEKGDA